jgi:hypothetical protein
MSEIYDGKTLSDLFRDIVELAAVKRTKLDDIIYDLRGHVKTSDDVVCIAPIIKDFFDVSIKNDDQLTKVATIAQRVITAEKNAGAGLDSLLSEEEKDELLKMASKSSEEDELKRLETISKDLAKGID